MMHCISKETSMPAKQLRFNNKRTQGEELVPVKCIYALPRVA